MHETCRIPSSFLGCLRSETSCKDHQQTPQDEHLLVLEQSLDLALDRSCIGVTTLQVPMHNSILYLLLKRLVRDKLSHVLPVGLVTFHLAFRG
jgi:hypothetical protein